MRVSCKQLIRKSWLLVLAALLLLSACGGGGGGSDSPAAAATESFPDVVSLSTAASYNTAGTSTGIVKDGDLVYVADGSSGLLVLRVAGNARLERVGSLALPGNGSAIDLTKAGNLLYVAAGSQGLLIVDVSVPEDPLLENSIDTPDTAGSILILGNRLYLSDWSDLLLFDLSNPMEPQLIGQTAGGAGAQNYFLDTAIFDDRIYAAGYSQGLNLVELSDSTPPRLVATMSMADSIYAAARSGSYLFTGGAGGLLQIYEARDFYPRTVASLPLGGGTGDASIYDIRIQGDYAYVANGDRGIRVVNIQDPTAPFLVASLETGGTCRNLSVDGNTIAAASASGGVVLVHVGISADRDGDGVGDDRDPFPDDPSESSDTDGDGIGNNADTDDDGDGVLDVDDAFPLDPLESADRDGDGVGDNADLFPDDSSEWADADGDQIGDNADTDDDNDGVLDSDDAFPFDPAESVDTDGDGIGNNADLDDDNDGVPDVEDDLPLDPNETLDTDGDGIGNKADKDDDYDGITDETDLSDDGTSLALDTDNDGIDNPDDLDDDGDGVVDDADLFPLDGEEWEDLDGDGLGDNSPNNRYAVIDTNFGIVKLELFEDLVPLTTKNFIRLAESGYYSDLIFHRVISDFMIQGGDPNGDGTGGPGYKIVDEFPKDDEGALLLIHDGPGVLSMANSGPDTGGSQFFITLVETPWLDGKHTVFGRVVEGMDVVNTIGLVETDSNDKPKSDVIIHTITIVDK